MGRSVLLIAAILLTGMAPRLDAAPVLPATKPDDQIAIVPQNQRSDRDDPDLGAWSPDDRFVLTLRSGDSGEALLRKVATGEVVNRLPLPRDPYGDIVMLNSLRFGADDTRAIATGLASQTGPHPRCRWVTYAIDFAGGTIAASSTDHAADACEPAVPSAARLRGVLAEAHRGGLRLADMLPGGAGPGLYIVDHAGKLVRSLQQPFGSLPTLGLRDAAMAADGRTLALILDSDGAQTPSAAADRAQTNGHVGDRPIQHTTLDFFDSTLQQFREPTTGDPVDGRQQQARKPVTLTGRYTRVRWIDAGHVLLTRNYIADERDVSANMHDDQSLFAPPPALVLDAGTGKVTLSAPMACYLAALPGGRLIGAGLANCLAQFGDAPRGLMLFAPGRGWQDFVPGVPGEGYVDALAVSPDGTSAAVLVRAGRDDDQWTLLAIDLASGAVTARAPLADAAFAGLDFDRSGRTVFVQTPQRRLLWQPASGQPPRDLVPAGTVNGGAWPDVVVADRGEVIDAPPGDTIVRIGAKSGARLSDLRFDAVVAAGFLPGKPQFWAASAREGLRFWDTRNWVTMQTILLFGGNHSLAYMPDGRYDTDLGPDSNTFRWRVSDQPERLLGPQTFMRAYYTPRLLDRIEQCIAVSGGCAAVFPHRPAPVDINRTLPQVLINRVQPGPRPATAAVEVTVTEGFDPGAPNGKTRSGLYDLRLFRNGRLVAGYPGGPGQAPKALTPGPDGKVHHRFVVALPTGAGNRRVTFSAYAFNSDRIKSDTATMAFVAPPAAARPRRAFVLAIGINAYAEPRLKLNYAANDAALIARRLAQLPRQQAVSTMTLTDGRASRAKILAALDLLAGGNRQADLATLGLRDSSFVKTTPDDTVIITFSGHGWADPVSNFFLLPADTKWPDNAHAPVPSSVLSSVELADALKPIDAGEMALVIDACHSAASVDTVWFKPGPMGDPGLGQLAFDKGIRILAAAGRDDLAHEDGAIRHGLLTYVLADLGIDASGFGAADLDGNHKIMLDEWLRYATAQLPVVSAQTAPQAVGHKLGGFTVIADNQAIAPRPQVPALFDFNHHGSTEVLREARR